ncbi:MAG: RlmE family RNA methyltransferase [Thermoplasmatota archaeon]
MSKEWVRQRKRDHYYKRAKAEGYRSRAAFKLKEINNRVRIIKPGHRVLDVGAAPGGWSQVAREIAGDKGLVVAVDMVPMPSIEGVKFIQGDIESDDTLDRILGISDRYDAVISDAAPKLSGNRVLDRGRAFSLCWAVLKMSKSVLRPGGNVLLKMFQGDEVDELKDEYLEYFHEMDVFKPKSSLKRSYEIFLLFRNFRSVRTNDL